MSRYFAYGSNMDRAAMRQRCPGATLLGEARLEDHRFFIAQCGYASVMPEAGAQVFGLLWDLPSLDEEALDDYEDVAGGLYAKELRDVAGRDSVTRALIYVIRNAKPGRPLRGYLEGVIAAARSLGFPEAYMRDIEALRR